MIRLRLIVQAVGLLSLSLALWILPSAAHASGLGVEPSAFRLTVDPGATEQHTLTISNGGTESVQLTTAIADVTALRDSGELKFTPLTSTKAPYTVSVVPSVATIEPGAKTTLTLTLKVQPDAEPGGYSQGVQLTTEATASSVQPGAISQRSVATVDVPVLFEVKGSRRIGGFLGSLLAEPRTVLVGQPVTLTSAVTNTGTIHTAATGTITVYAGQSTQVVDTVVLPRQLVFPAAVRAITARWTAPKIAGQYRLVLDETLAAPDGVEPGQHLSTETTVTVRASTWLIWVLLTIAILESIWLIQSWHRRRGLFTKRKSIS